MADEKLDNETQDEATEAVVDEADADPVEVEAEVDAVEELFEVKVAAVNIVKVQSKPKRRGFTKGRRPGWKKAIVELREGYEIEIFEGAAV